jgi:general stress protein 26
MDVEELKNASVELMETAQAVYLTTNGPGGYPHTRAMLNLRNREQYPGQVPLFAGHREDLLVYFSTNTGSQKLRQIEADPRVSAYYCNPGQFHGLMLSGDAEILDDSALRNAIWNEGWERYYPGGPDDPGHTVLRLRPKRLVGWYKATRFEFEIEDE